MEAEVGNIIKFPPTGRAAYKPKAAPSEFWEGSKNPLATTTSATPSRLAVARGTWYEATVVLPSAVLTSKV